MPLYTKADRRAYERDRLRRISEGTHKPAQRNAPGRNANIEVSRDVIKFRSEAIAACREHERYAHEAAGILMSAERRNKERK